MILYQIRNSIFKWRWRVKNIINQFVSACLTSIVICLTFTATVGEAKIDSESMAAIWIFDEGKGKEVKDSTANGNDGKITGNPKWVGGKLQHGELLRGINLIFEIDSDVRVRFPSKRGIDSPYNHLFPPFISPQVVDNFIWDLTDWGLCMSL